MRFRLELAGTIHFRVRSTQRLWNQINCHVAENWIPRIIARSMHTWWYLDDAKHDSVTKRRCVISDDSACYRSSDQQWKYSAAIKLDNFHAQNYTNWMRNLFFFLSKCLAELSRVGKYCCDEPKWTFRKAVFGFYFLVLIFSVGFCCRFALYFRFFVDFRLLKSSTCLWRARTIMWIFVYNSVCSRMGCWCLCGKEIESDLNVVLHCGATENDGVQMRWLEETVDSRDFVVSNSNRRSRFLIYWFEPHASGWFAYWMWCRLYWESCI